MLNQWIDLVVDQAFTNLIGQTNAISVLKDFCRTALTRIPTEGQFNVALIGGPSTGKTTLAKAVADALSLPRLLTDAKAVRSGNRLAATLLDIWEKTGHLTNVPGGNYGTITQLSPGVVFLDEVQKLSQNAQEELLKPTERSDATLTTDTAQIDCKRIWWILGTTHWGSVIAPLRSRFLPVTLVPYSTAEVERILALRLGWDAPACKEAVRLFGTLVREILLFSDLVNARAHSIGRLNAIQSVAHTFNIDQYGVRPERRAILATLHRHPDGLLLRTLAAATNLPKEDLTNIYLPTMLAPTDGGEPWIRQDQRYYLTASGEAIVRARGYGLPPG